MTSVRPDSLQQFALDNDIKPSEMAGTFGTYCSSRPDTKTDHKEPSHLLNQWFRFKNRTVLLSKCAGLLCHDEYGKLTIISVPTLTVDEGTDHPFIIAMKGNSVLQPKVVSVSRKALHQSVISFIPGSVYPSMGHTKIFHAADLKAELVNVPLLGGEAFLASLPTVLPLEFGHGVDENMTSETIQGKLAARHPYYSDWIDSITWLFRHHVGYSLHFKLEALKIKLPESVAAPSDTAVVPLVYHLKGSQPWAELSSSLERIRRFNLESWLRNNRATKEGTTRLLLPPPSPTHQRAKTTPNHAQTTPPNKPKQQQQQQHNSNAVASISTQLSMKRPAVGKATSIVDKVDQQLLVMPPFPRKVSITEPSMEKQMVPHKTVANTTSAVKELMSLSPLRQLAVTTETSNPEHKSKAREESTVNTSKSLEQLEKEMQLLNSSPAKHAVVTSRDGFSSPSRQAVITAREDVSSPSKKQALVTTPEALSSASTRQALATTPEGLSSPSTKQALDTPRLDLKRGAATDGEDLGRKKTKLLDASGVDAKILSALAELHVMNIERAPLILVALFSGYLNPNSSGFKNGLKQLKNDGIVENAGTGFVKLADCDGDLPVSNPPKSNQEMHERLLKVLIRTSKLNNADKLRKIWVLLSDGEEHEIVDAAKAAGYTNTKSKGLTDVIKVLQEVGFLNRRGSAIKLDSILFPFDENIPAEMIVAI